jgi:Tol biopolymer transport system component
MTLSAGSKLGPYEILAPIGAGGMGEVYRAKDTRLDRTVAIKVLPSHLSADPERKQRFEREARTISSLNHPHICTLHDIGHQDGIDYLVMEYVEGESLAQRLEKGPLTTELVLRTGIQIAEALDKAHRQSIIHRDLKPGNIMLTKSGAKLLDFGLAKLQETKRPEAGQSQMQTAGKPLTEEGVVLGTVQYMAPEQLEGKEIDSRTDIFALGTVLYEMATAQKAFAGKSQASLISAILKDEPAPISQIQPMTPPALDRVVKNCLAKDPDDRWQTAHDVTLQLKWISESGSQAGTTTPVVMRKKRAGLLTTLAVFVSIIATAAALLLGYAYLKAVQKPQAVIRATIELPEKWSLTEGMALSPNGRLLAFVAYNQGKSALWIRALEKTDAEELAGTEGAIFPFWSPDSRLIGFFQAGKMKKIDPSGGPATVICDAPNGRGGTWNRSGLILFAPAPTSAIYQVAADGGKPSAVTKQPASQTVSHRWPSFLPDGRHFLYLVNSGEQAGIFVGSLDSPEAKRVASDLSNAAYVSPGYLLFVRGSTLMGQSFDPGQQVLNGEPFRITHQKISSWLTGNFSSFTVADGGLLAYHRASIPLTQMRWYDRSGHQTGSVGEPGYYDLMDIARDNNNVLVKRFDPETLDGDLWVFDAVRDSASRVTFQPGKYNWAAFSFDGQRIVYGREPQFDILAKSTTGTEAEQLLLHSDEGKVPTGWSPDGRLILYHKQTKKGNMELWLLPVTGSQRPAPFLQTPFNSFLGSFSPDGKWIAYTSDESGRGEVYVRAVSGPRQWQVSTNGGLYAQWQKDGKELYYGSPDSKIMAVEIKPGPDFAFGPPHPIFDPLPSNMGNWIAPDGQRILCNIPVNDSGPASAPISLVVNWPAGLH